MIIESTERLVCRCGKRIRIPDRLRGRALRCKACGSRLQSRLDESADATPKARPSAPTPGPRVRKRRSLSRRKSAPGLGGEGASGLWRWAGIRLIGVAIALVASLIFFMVKDRPSSPGTWRPGHGITVERPAGWAVEKSDSGEPFMKKIGTGFFGWQVNVSAYPADGVELWQLDATAAEWLAEDGATFHSSSLRQQDGREMLVMQYERQDPLDGRCTFRELVFRRGGELVYVSASAPSKDWTRARAPLDAILKSVRFD